MPRSLDPDSTHKDAARRPGGVTRAVAAAALVLGLATPAGATQPALAPSLSLPWLRAATPGDATITAAAEIDGVVAYAPDRGLIAVMRTEASWGTCTYETALELRDASSGERVASTPIIARDETSIECDDLSDGVLPRARPTIARRIAALTGTLRTLGFMTAGSEAAAIAASGDGQLARFTRARLELVVTDGVAVLRRGDAALASATVLAQVTAARHVESAGIVVLWSTRAALEGVEGTDPTDVTVICVIDPGCGAAATSSPP